MNNIPNPSDEKLREMIVEKDAERYRKLKPLFHKSIIMTNGRRWWDCHICTDPEIETLDAVVDALPEVES